jgi:hypothetical protein
VSQSKLKRKCGECRSESDDRHSSHVGEGANWGRSKRQSKAFGFHRRNLRGTLLSVPPFVPAQAGSLRPGQCNRDCSRTVRPISSWARTRRYRSCACSRSRQLLGIKLDIFTLSDLIALDDICRIHLIGRFGIDLAVLDTVAGFLIELNERNLRRAVFGTTQRCQQRNEQHLRQVVIAVAPARVDDLRKVFCEASQDGLLANQGTLSESIFLGRAIDWPKFHAIPLGSRGGSFWGHQ